MNGFSFYEDEYHRRQDKEMTYYREVQKIVFREVESKQTKNGVTFRRTK